MEEKADGQTTRRSLMMYKALEENRKEETAANSEIELDAFVEKISFMIDTVVHGAMKLNADISKGAVMREFVQNLFEQMVSMPPFWQTCAVLHNSCLE